MFIVPVWHTVFLPMIFGDGILPCLPPLRPAMLSLSPPHMFTLQGCRAGGASVHPLVHVAAETNESQRNE